MIVLADKIQFGHSDSFERIYCHCDSARRTVMYVLTDKLRSGQWEHSVTLDQQPQIHQVQQFPTPFTETVGVYNEAFRDP